jgi:hypothetical protein
MWNLTISLGFFIGNVSAIGYINYTICDFWDKIEALSLNVSIAGNGTAISNDTSSGGMSSTSSGLTATVTVEGTTVRTAFLVVLFTSLAVGFNALLAL